MKKLFWILAVGGVLLYLGVLPFQANDVAALLPVETVIVTRSGASLRIDIEDGLHALGQTVSDALDALQEQAPGKIFFQTAEQVVVSEDAAGAVPQVIREARFRPAAGLYLTPAEALEPETVSAYLKTRHSPLTLGQAQAALAQDEGLTVPRLLQADGGLRVLE